MSRVHTGRVPADNGEPRDRHTLARLIVLSAGNLHGDRGAIVGDYFDGLHFATAHVGMLARSMARRLLALA